MTREDLAHQFVIMIRGSGPGNLQVLHSVFSDLDPYHPYTLAHWSLPGAPGEPAETLVHFVRLNPIPEPAVIQGLNTDRVQIEPNHALAAAARPNDSLFDEQWALEKMSAEAAWDCALRCRAGGRNVVAVIDSGIHRAHPDLHPRVNPAGRRFIGGAVDPDFEDEDGHGTFLAGTIGAVTDNLVGVASASWPLRVSLLALKFYDPWNPLNAADAAQAIAYAVTRGARVINASWHVGTFSQTLFNHVAFAANHDVLFVAAAGNEGTNNDRLPVWPANFVLPNVVSVMATDRHDERPSFSNYGDLTVDLAAPGVGVLSTHYYFNPQPPRWRAYSGTSVAAAHVTAAAALVRRLRPGWSASQVRAHLMASVDPLPGLRCLAGGRLNLQKAICSLCP